MGFAAEEVIDHPIDRLLITRNDPGRQHNRIALLDSSVLVIVHRGARQRRHRLTLRSTDQHANFFGWKVLYLSRMYQQAFRNFEISKILGNFGRTDHRPANERHFSAVLPRQFDRKLNAMDGR